MAVYVPTVWKNGQEPFINALNLNHMERGIEAAHEDLGGIIDGSVQVGNAKVADRAITVDKATQTTVGGAKIWVDETDPDNVIGYIDAR